jgi:uncharacterized membrane protein YcaP (DUF421 family)
LLISLQFLITSLLSRFDGLKKIIKAASTMLFDRGEFLLAKMKEEHVSESEILTAIRAAGSASFVEIAAIVPETDGSLTVVKKSPDGGRSALSDVAWGREKLFQSVRRP